MGIQVVLSGGKRLCPSCGKTFPKGSIFVDCYFYNGYRRACWKCVEEAKNKIVKEVIK